MTDDMIDFLAEKIGEQLRVATCEMRDDIKAAELAIYQETQDNDDAKPKLALSFAVGVNLLNRNVETKLSISVKHTCKGNVQLPDPSQPEFEATKDAGAKAGALALEAQTVTDDGGRALALA